MSLAVFFAEIEGYTGQANLCSEFLGVQWLACEMQNKLREDTQDSLVHMKAFNSKIWSHASPSFVLQNLLVFVIY